MTDLVISAAEAMGNMVLVPDTVTQDEFTYGVTFNNLAAGTRQSGQIIIQADADFLIHNQTMYAGGSTASNKVIPEVMVMLTDTGSGRKLFSEPVPLDCVFGSGQLPYILPLPKYMLSRAILEVELTNISLSTNYASISLSFNGVKVFNKS